MKTHDNKIAIITGGKQGIGRGIANLLAQRGAQVVIVNR
ncbi:SDR family NAD(P)-dependent oxidoreductase [Listeria monocytogenes]